MISFPIISLRLKCHVFVSVYWVKLCCKMASDGFGIRLDSIKFQTDQVSYPSFSACHDGYVPQKFPTHPTSSGTRLWSAFLQGMLCFIFTYWEMQLRETAFVFLFFYFRPFCFLFRSPNVSRYRSHPPSRTPLVLPKIGQCFRSCRGRKILGVSVLLSALVNWSNEARQVSSADKYR